MYEVAIIGTGPAGISASLTLKLRNKNILLLGQKTLSEKIKKAPLVKNYLGLPSISGENLQKAFLQHLNQMQIEITNDFAKMIYAMGDYFLINGTKENQNYKAKSIILATGVNNSKNISGEKQFLGRGVSYCATCDGFFYKNKTIAIIAENEKSLEEIKYLSQIAQKVFLFAPFLQNLPKIEKLNNSANVEKLENSPNLNDFFNFIKMQKNISLIEENIEKIEGNLKAEKIVCSNSSFSIDGVFILKESVDLEILLPGIECENNFIKVDKNMKTNIAGCFACGDCVGKPFQYAKAIGEGNIAAHSVCNFLDMKK